MLRVDFLTNVKGRQAKANAAYYLNTEKRKNKK